MLKQNSKAHAPLTERFGRYVYLTETDCWEWRGAKNEHGYGVIGKGGRRQGNTKAHRVSYELFYGVQLTPKECVCHSCDNPACVNPNHLFLGSQKDNIVDMWSKRRGSKPPVRVGTANNKAKLSEQQVLEIRKIASSGSSSRKIASLFNISHKTVLAIINRKTWRHV